MALLLVVLVAALAPVAYADPPDPSWMGGLWDDDDFDNTVALVTALVRRLTADEATRIRSFPSLLTSNPVASMSVRSGTPMRMANWSRSMGFQ